MCVPNSPLFQRCQVYDWPPFFNKKYMNGPIFLDSYVKGPIFLTSWYMHIFFAQRFFEAAYPLGITWIDCDICPTTSKKWVQKNKGQYMNRSTFGWSSIWMGPFFKGQVYERGRFWNTGSHVRTKITPKLPRPTTHPSVIDVLPFKENLPAFLLCHVCQLFYVHCIDMSMCVTQSNFTRTRSTRN